MRAGQVWVGACKKAQQTQLNLEWLFFNQILAVLKLKLQKPFLLKTITPCFHNISVPCTCKLTMNRDCKSKYPIKKKKSTVVVSFQIRYSFQYSTVRPVKIPCWACIFHLKEDHSHVPFPRKIVESCLKVPSNLFYFSFIASTHLLHLFLPYFLSFLKQKILNKAVWSTFCGSSSIVLALLCSPHSPACEEMQLMELHDGHQSGFPWKGGLIKLDEKF